ncbi:hypothetical protein Theos_1308 [Thermus oshimai JL-2]|uniref:NurA domain-containing protein n=1 Tax=Thermus oshimai JL-2 TaxID=751945 RepID=K7QZM2_THEOS|nr:hypothetical protein [Thermus oshimai]AFV76345.1 hypothetical protein Theos_1308 [Thermus oshimai JL-2]
MFDPKTYNEVVEAVWGTVQADMEVLETLRREVRPLREGVFKIARRRATTVSLVATDGGSNQLRFDPFLIHFLRVVDSNKNQCWFEVVTPSALHKGLIKRHFDEEGKPKSPLGRMMAFLGVKTLEDLSPMLKTPPLDEPPSPSWIGVYRELTEWAVLLDFVRYKDFASDTLLVFDGLLRSKVFAKDLFARLIEGLEKAVEEKWVERKRHIYLVGVAKRSKVLDRYRLAMRLEGVLDTSYPAYVEVPRELEKKAYIWSEYARGREEASSGGEASKFVGGKMFLVKFGSHPHDPIWPVDIFEPQAKQAGEILGYLLNDAEVGFPIPHYPASLQKAHEGAALVGLDFDLLQDQVFAALRKSLGAEAKVLDVFRLEDDDLARRRYR